MGPQFLLTASLLLGQAQVTETVEYFNGSHGWTATQTKSYSKSYNRTWTSTSGWVTTSTSGNRDERPTTFRLGERISALFGRQGGSALEGWKPPMQGDEPGESEGNLPLPPEERPALVSALPLEDAAEETVAVPTRTLTVAPAPLPSELQTATTRKTPTRIALTPGGELTIEAVEPEEEHPAAVKTAVFGFKSKSPVTLNASYLSQLAFSADYSVMTGQLRVEDGIYALHYAASDRADRLGGVVLLEMKGDLTPLRNGDLVEARGSLFTRRDGSVVYRPGVIRILKRE